MQRRNRTDRIIIPCNEIEKKLIRAAADKAGLPTATWIRTIIRNQIDKTKKEV